MADAVATHVCTVIAATIGAEPSAVRPETPLRGAELGIGWRKLYLIADQLERDYGIRFDLGAVDLWTSAADIILATEAAIALAAPLAAAAQRGRAA